MHYRRQRSVHYVSFTIQMLRKTHCSSTFHCLWLPAYRVAHHTMKTYLRISRKLHNLGDNIYSHTSRFTLTCSGNTFPLEIQYLLAFRTNASQSQLTRLAKNPRYKQHAVWHRERFERNITHFPRLVSCHRKVPHELLMIFI